MSAGGYRLWAFFAFQVGARSHRVLYLVHERDSASHR
jgi:hypothetical protein